MTHTRVSNAHLTDTHVADTHVADKHSLGTIPDAELLRRLRDILRDSRRTESDLVAHVGEVDRRRLYAREASPSMFVYCTRVLHLSGAEAYLRITAARAARKHPMLLAMLADGRLHLSGIAKLAPCLTRENRDAILSRATHRSKREIEELVAEIAPRADVPARLRKLPDVVRREGSPPALDPASGREGCVHESGADATRAAVGDERLAAHAAAPGELSGVALVAGRKSAEELRPDGVGGPGILQPTEPPRAPALDLGRPSSRSVVEPLAPSRYRVEFTASGELRDKLERLQALLRVELPGADLSAVIDRAVSETLQRLEARRYARTRTPRTGVEVPARPARRDGSRSRGASRPTTAPDCRRWA